MLHSRKFGSVFIFCWNQNLQHCFRLLHINRRQLCIALCRWLRLQVLYLKYIHCTLKICMCCRSTCFILYSKKPPLHWYLRHNSNGAKQPGRHNITTGKAVSVANSGTDITKQLHRGRYRFSHLSIILIILEVLIEKIIMKRQKRNWI